LTKKNLLDVVVPNLNSNSNSHTTTNTASTILTNGSYDSYENEEQDSMLGSEIRSHERSYDHEDLLGNERMHIDASVASAKLATSSNTKLIQWQKSKLYLNETISLDVDDGDEKVVGILV
jgi:hypothetical protein